MTKLSVNINKVALIRNARGRDFPSVERFAESCIELGAHGITLHPRPDQRHARYSDVRVLKTLCDKYGVELNVEGYPSDEFLRVVLEAEPTQCTLVPDDPDQITSDHGWEVSRNAKLLEGAVYKLKERNIRTSLFVDHGTSELGLIRDMGADRIELYTEPYADSFFDQLKLEPVLRSFRCTSTAAQNLGLGVNAGHDLNLDNLDRFLSIPGIMEVSIGHSLVVESIERGIGKVLENYLKIVANGN
ncbi:MAG: pyridoxine 5'-phosphate synthase [Akkermansiaceae bacterium]|nr:pyridoxine 5'-phosphate synthase [Akkermansiaceae bacterium]